MVGARGGQTRKVVAPMPYWRSVAVIVVGAILVFLLLGELLLHRGLPPLGY